MSQLTFDLPHRPAMGRADFFVSDANAAAVQGIEAWADWPFAKAILVGPEGAGKTHLAHVWAALTGAEIVAATDLAARAEPLRDAVAVAVEDASEIAGQSANEEALFHLHNALSARAAPLLLTAREPAAHWHLGLPDLASRMAQAGLLRMGPPDDALLTAVMVKLSQDRQLAVRPTTLAYAAARVERSFAAAARFIEALDALAMAEQRAPTRDLARIVLSGLSRA
ncbi:MAG: DnaA/Hda family protein [Pseudomonadota bacterium]